MKKAELEKLYHKTMPGTEHGKDHDGPKTDHDDQQGDGHGLSLAPDPRAQKGAGHCGPDMHKKQSGKGHSKPKPAQAGAGKPSYRAFVAAKMRKNGGNLKDAAAKWKSQKGAGHAKKADEQDGKGHDEQHGKGHDQKGGTLLDAIKSVEGKYDNFMAQHPVLNDIKTGAEVVGALGSVIATGGADAPAVGALAAADAGELGLGVAEAGEGAAKAGEAPKQRRSYETHADLTIRTFVLPRQT